MQGQTGQHVSGRERRPEELIHIQMRHPIELGPAVALRGVERLAALMGALRLSGFIGPIGCIADDDRDLGMLEARHQARCRSIRINRDLIRAQIQVVGREVLDLFKRALTVETAPQRGVVVPRPSSLWWRSVESRSIRSMSHWRHVS